MNKNIIIGAAFSAAITKILIENNTTVIGSKSHLVTKDFSRRKSIECNKILSKKAFSYGSLKFDLKNGVFQDRVILGGNSNIWGGKLNLKNIPLNLIKKLKQKNIHFQKLSYEKTGTISNNKNIVQLQSTRGKILKSQDLPIKIQDGHLINFFIKKNKIFLLIKLQKLKKIEAKNLFLCVGDIQLLDLLYRSGFLKENDIIEFSEFQSNFRLRSIFSSFKKNITTVRFHFCRALGHYLGVQYFSKLLKLLKIIPLCLDQNFYKKKFNYKLKISNGFVVEKDSNKQFFFGKSSHYCFMRINGVEINKYLSKIHPNIIGIGMSFVKQKEPGPISNDIILDINKKILRKKL